MGGSLNFYMPAEVQASLGGAPIDGFAPGSIIEYERVAERTNEVVGTQGDVGVAVIKNPLVSVKFKLLQTSASNDTLSALANAQDNATAATIAAALSIADMSGTTRLSGKAWIKKDPTVGFSDTVETREWTLMCRATTFVIGGNRAIA